MKMAPRQTNREELLDLNYGTLAQVRESLHDIRRINTWLGGAKVATDATFGLLEKRGLQRATVLDIGTGSADIPLRLVRAARRRGLSLEIVALDLSERHLQVAREDLGDERSVHLLRADAFRLPFADASMDIVVASLFLHHFRPPQIIQLLHEFSRVSRHGWAINDLVRHHLPIVFFRLTRPIFARSYLTRHDGEASIRRGYTTEETREILCIGGFDEVKVCAQFPYRMSLTYEKVEEAT